MKLHFDVNVTTSNCMSKTCDVDPNIYQLLKQINAYQEQCGFVHQMCYWWSVCQAWVLVHWPHWLVPGTDL